MAHAVMMTTRMHGTDDVADLVNILITKDLDNGSILELNGPATNYAEAFAVKAPAAQSATLGKLVVLCEPEVMADPRLNRLSDFYNKKNTVCRAFILRSGDEFGLSADGLTGSAAVGAKVGCDGSEKLAVVSSGELGTIVAKYNNTFIIRVN